MDKYDKNVPSEYDGLFQKAADANGVSYDLLRKVAWTESRFKPTAKSKTGPLGMMQFTKATAKAMGLRVTGGADDDRLNPELAVNAAAKHLATLVGKFDGDELKAALAYNQGEGRLGNPQLEAYSKGDFAKISEEGRNYMRNLLDVAKSPMSGQLESFGGITPKGKGIPADVGLAGIDTKQKVTRDLPESTSFNVTGKEQEAPAKPFAKDFWETHGETLDEYNDRSTFFGFKSAVEAEASNSVAGVAFRAGRLDNGFDVFKDTITPTKWNSEVWTPEELERIRTEVKNPAYINVVTGGSPENLDALIKMANENYETDMKAADAGLGAKLSAGVIGAGLDPLSYVPMVGVSGKGFKLVNKALVVGSESAALNVASEGLRTSVAGGDADYAGAALGGFVFASGMSALSDAIAASLRKGKPDVEFDNEFIGPAMRMEARETARNANSTDLSRMDTTDVNFDGDFKGVPYAAHPTEEGAAILHDGSIISPENILNPMTAKEFSEVSSVGRARAGVSLGGFSEIGQKTLRSESDEVRAIASDLVRTPVGMQGTGASGKFGATASDIIERLRGTDNRTYNDLYHAVREAMQDPEFTTGGAKMSRTGARQEVYRRAALAIERPELQGTLTKSELKVMKIMKEHFDVKRELMENPAVFGNKKAVSIFPESRHKGTYVPHVYDRAAKASMLQRYGAEGLQEAITESWLTSYHARPEVKARVDEALMELHGVQEVTPEMVRKYAMDKAYGISHSDQFSASSVIDENIEGLVGIENNSFLEARNLFDSDMATTLPDGTPFSVNDLRDFDMFRIMPAYDRRINGDIAIMGGTGKTTKELKDEILNLQTKFQGDGKRIGDAKALGDIVKILTGRARRNQDTAFETFVRGMNDLSFFAKNAYMGIQNYTEMGAMLAKGNVRALGSSVPYLRDVLYKNKPVSANELREIHSSLFGKEIDSLIRPSREDIVQRLRESTDTGPMLSNIVGTFKYGTQELAARSIFTKILNGSSNHILDAARQGMLGNVIDAALTGRNSKWAKETFLRGAAVTEDQWKGITQLIRDHMVQGEDGKFKVKDKKAFAMDARSMDLWRLADRVADETILRPHKVSNQDAAAYGALVKMAFQFKSFTIKSLNSRFVKGLYDAFQDNRAIDAALTSVFSMGLAGAFYAMSTHMKAAALPDEQRKAYLDRALHPKMIGFASYARSSHVGAPIAMLDLIGAPFGYSTTTDVRTSIIPKVQEPRDPNKPFTKRELASEFMGNLGEQMPSIGYAAGVASLGRNLAGVLSAPNKATAQDFMTGMWNANREIVPNDPLTQQLLLKIYEAQGINLKERKK